MSLEQYKDASRKELWDILQIQMQVLQAESTKVTELEKDLESCLVMLESFHKNTGSLGAKSLAVKIRDKALKEGKQ